MAAAAIYANKKGVSKTDLSNSWITKPERVQNLKLKHLLTFPQARFTGPHQGELHQLI